MSDVTFGVKMPEELKQQIDGLMKDSGLRTGKDFMQSLINSYVLEKAKENIPEVAEDLKELQTLTQRIDNIYLNLGYRIENLTKSQHDQKQQELNKKDSIIEDLQNKIEILKADKDTITEGYNDIVNQKNEYIKRVNELTESNNNIKALNEEYKGKVDTLSGIIEEYKGYKEENKNLKELLAAQQGDNVRLQDNIKLYEFNLAQANKTIEDNNVQHEATLGKLKRDHQEELLNIKDKLDLVKDKALLEKDKEHQKALEQIQEKHNKEISDYQEKYKALLEQLEKEKSIPKTNKKATQQENK